MSLRIENKQRVLKLDTPGIRLLVDLILDDHGRRNSDLTVVFARDDFVRNLNASYRDVDRTTDVLAFATCDGDPPGIGGYLEDVEHVLGDVIISTDRAIAQAPRYRRTPEREILKLVAHGVLHLVGYDHTTSTQRTKMRNLENGYIRTLLKNRQ